MPTALELTREEWQPYIEAAGRHQELHKPTPFEQPEREALLSRVRQAAAALKARFGARRVILFGSLADAEWFTPDSDVDLAVEGITADVFWQAWRLTEEIIDDRAVDLVDIETARASLVRALERHGVEL
jgi:predicted nucleotidyltransferase